MTFVLIQEFPSQEVGSGQSHLNSRTEAKSRVRIKQLTMARSIDTFCKLLGKLDAIALGWAAVTASCYITFEKNVP